MSIRIVLCATLLVACASDVTSNPAIVPDVGGGGFAGAQAPIQSYGGSSAPVIAEPPAYDPEPSAPPPAAAGSEAPKPVDPPASDPSPEPKPTQTAGAIAVVSAGSGGMPAAGQPAVAGAGGSASTAGTMAAGGAGGSAAPEITRCKLASKQIIACDAFSKQYFPSWLLIWIVPTPGTTGSVTYNCNGSAPKCIKGSQCTVVHADDNGRSEMGICQ